MCIKIDTVLETITIKNTTLLLTGLHEVENIKPETLFNSIKNPMGWMEKTLTEYKVQCYDGTSNMVVAKTRAATRINEIKSMPLWHTATVTLLS